MSFGFPPLSSGILAHLLRVGEVFRRCLAEFAAVGSRGSRDLVGIVGLLSGPLKEFTYLSEP